VRNDRFFCENKPDFVEITIKGLVGGHSGSDIHLHRANAIQLLVNFLWQTQQKYPLSLCHIEGGGLHNAIAREAKALFAIPFAHREHIRIDWNIYTAEMEDNWLADEPKMRFDLSSRPKQEKVLSPILTQNLLSALHECPHGVIAMSQTLNNVVETSTNLASIKKIDNQYVITTSQRSSQENSLNQLAFQVYNLFTQYESIAAIGKGYPAWQPHFNSALVQTAQKTYQDVFGKEARVNIIHAGLECGLFSQAMPQLELISFGPTLLGVHSPDERLNIDSTNRMQAFLLQLLENLSV
jgi:dipeptidase D